MFLFQQKERIDASYDEHKIYVISVRTDINHLLCQRLRQAGYGAVESVEIAITQLSSLTLSECIGGIIIDIGDSEAVEEIINLLHSLIPRQIWCCLVGDSDSIALAQAFAHNKIRYYNLKTQLDQAITAILKGEQLDSNRSAVSINVLGCKGGVGTTTLAWQLARAITHQRHLPLLYIQGGYGSRDLDLLAGSKLAQEITPLTNNLDVMSSTGDAYPELPPEITQRYNFILFEQSIAAADKEQMRILAEKPRCLILVIERSLSSIRAAHSMIEHVKLLRRTRHAPCRLFVCLNDTRPVAGSDLSLADVTKLLNHPLDIVFPYSRRGSQMKPAAKQRFNAPQEQLVRYVLGDRPKIASDLLSRLISPLRRGH